MKRRGFLKGLLAAAALAISGLVLDLAPNWKRRATRWSCVLTMPGGRRMEIPLPPGSEPLPWTEGARARLDQILIGVVES